MNRLSLSVMFLTLLACSNEKSNQPAPGPTPPAGPAENNSDKKADEALALRRTKIADMVKGHDCGMEARAALVKIDEVESSLKSLFGSTYEVQELYRVGLSLKAVTSSIEYQIQYESKSKSEGNGDWKTLIEDCKRVGADSISPVERVRNSLVRLAGGSREVQSLDSAITHFRNMRDLNPRYLNPLYPTVK